MKLLKMDVSFVLYCLLFNLLGLINELFKISVFKFSIFVDFMLGMNEIPLLSSCSLFVCIGISPIVYMYSEIFFYFWLFRRCFEYGRWYKKLLSLLL